MRWACSVADLAIPTKDLSVAPSNGCSAFAGCISDCFAAVQGPTLAGCSALCGAPASSAARDLYFQAYACAESHCLGDVDAGNGACVLADDGSGLLNADGTPLAKTDPGIAPKACGQCLTDAKSRLFGAACTPGTPFDCAPAECLAVTNACLAN